MRVGRTAQDQRRPSWLPRRATKPAPAPAGRVAQRDARLDRAADWRDARYQAFALMRLAFTVAPIAFGLDKFFNVMVDWPIYLAPWINDIAPGSGQDFMYVVGATEILAGVSWRSSLATARNRRRMARGDHPQPAHALRLLRHRPARLRPHARRRSRSPGWRRSTTRRCGSAAAEPGSLQSWRMDAPGGPRSGRSPCAGWGRRAHLHPPPPPPPPHDRVVPGATTAVGD